jgi:hypothetical protein
MDAGATRYLTSAVHEFAAAAPARTRPAPPPSLRVADFDLRRRATGPGRFPPIGRLCSQTVTGKDRHAFSKALGHARTVCVANAAWLSGWTVTLNDDRSATLILRVWLEGGTDNFRGRLTAVDTSAGQEGGELTLRVTSSPSDMLDVVRAWLDEFLGQAPQPADGGN